jgi:hypothetical protein
MANTVNFDACFQKWAEDLDLLRQNQLLSESSFLAFAKDRGTAVRGLITGEPSEFHKQGWLKSDTSDHEGEPYFHPFRLYPLDRVIERIATMRLLPTEAKEKAVGKMANSARDWNAVADLGILLEPIHWPDMVGRMSLNLGLRESEYRQRLVRYRDEVHDFIRSLDVELWRERHQSLRIEAGWIDGNFELYLLLRLSHWEQRKKLKGSISRALWFRHLAEVIRRSFEDVFPERWQEEDEAFGHWMPGGRKREFGADRPLDDELRAKPYLAYSFGLFTGSAVRWYLEGETEYYAVLEILPEPHRLGIELVNLQGSIESGRDNTALKLEAMLMEDKALRRFSQISFDLDVLANKKAIQNQVRQGNVVGAVWTHAPDFEFANFALSELIDVAVEIDAENGFSDAGPLRNADWVGISKGRDFEKRYCASSTARPRSLKGEHWGRALATYANRLPRRSDTGEVRPLLYEVRAAVHGWISNYDLQKQAFEIDPDSFKQVRRKDGDG